MTKNNTVLDHKSQPVRYRCHRSTSSIIICLHVKKQRRAVSILIIFLELG